MREALVDIGSILGSVSV
jgi:hypothetical protein